MGPMQVQHIMPHVLGVVLLAWHGARHAVRAAVCALKGRPCTLAGLEELTGTYVLADGPGSFLVGWQAFCWAPE